MASSTRLRAEEPKTKYKREPFELFGRSARILLKSDVITVLSKYVFSSQEEAERMEAQRRVKPNGSSCTSATRVLMNLGKRNRINLWCVMSVK